MAFHRQPQFARLALHNLHQIAFGGGNARQRSRPSCNSRTRRREADGRGFALKQRRAEIVSSTQAGATARIGSETHAGLPARFFQSQQGTQMAQFNNAFSHGGMGVGNKKAAFYSGLKAQCYSVGPICVLQRNRLGEPKNRCGLLFTYRLLCGHFLRPMPYSKAA